MQWFRPLVPSQHLVFRDAVMDALIDSNDVALEGKVGDVEVASVLKKKPKKNKKENKNN